MLLRHTREIQAELVGNARISGAVGAEWKMEWLNIANPVIPAAQQAQGILITAETKSNAIQRWILITERGSHQSIQLSYSKEDLNAAQHAQDTFRKSLQSQRITEDLNLGRAWISKSLETLNPDEWLGKQVNFGTLARAQAYWISQLSIDPGKIEPYFLLGQTARLLSDPAALVKSMARFAQDIAAEDPKTLQLKRLAESFSPQSEHKRR